jgi:hypothetical protein
MEIVHIGGAGGLDAGVADKKNAAASRGISL